MGKKKLSDQTLEKLLPGLKMIDDPTLKNKIMTAWRDMYDRSSWDDLNDVWIDPRNPMGERLLPHVNRLVDLCLVTCDVFNQYQKNTIDKQLLLALALMHDVSKVVEFEPDGCGGCCFSKIGKEFQHATFGTIIAQQLGMGDKLVHLIHTHTAKSGMQPRLPEGLLFRHLDIADFELASYREQEEFP